MQTKRIAMISGSFDPVTSGHTDLIRRAAGLFDWVYVAVMSNGEKDSAGSGMFTYDERLAMLRASCDALAAEGIVNVSAELCVGLASDFAAAHDVRYIVRGARTGTDYDYEASLASIMKRFDARLETVILPADPILACVSSTYVRELIKYHCPIGDAMPTAAAVLARSFFDSRAAH